MRNTKQIQANQGPNSKPAGVSYLAAAASSRSRLALIFFAFLLSVTGRAAFGQSNGPVAYWNFDASTVSGVQVGDSSGNSINGTIMGGVSPTAGVINQGLSFNGVSGYIVSSSNALTDLTNNLSLSLWVKTQNNSRLETLISRYNASGYEYGYLLRDDAAGHLEMRIGAYNGVWSTLIDSGSKLVNDGQWHHVAAVITLGQGVSFYIDGTLNSTQAANVVAYSCGSPLQIGLTAWNPYGMNFTGSMDDVRVYNRALAASEIATLANPTVASTPAVPLAVPALAVSASSLTFNATVGAANPASQSVNVSNSATGTLGSWTVSPSTSATWLAVSPASASGAQAISVTASIAGLTAGTYNGTVTVNAPGAAPSSQVINVSLTVAPQPVTAAPVTGGSGPVAYWSFDASTVSGVQVGDSSGNGNNGTIVGGVSPTAGVINQGLSFNGTSGYITASSTPLTDLTNNLSLSLWVKTQNNSRLETLISRYNASGYEYGYLLRDDAAGHLEMRIGAYNGVWSTLVDSGSKLVNDGQWHHVAAVITLGKGVSFYIDGTLNSTQAANVVAYSCGSALEIGLTQWTAYGMNFTGSMDDVRVYNRALVASEIATLANPTQASTAPTTPPPVTVAAPVPGVLAVNASSVSFGSASVGSLVSQALTISNTGGSSLTISQASISGSGFSMSGLSTPMTLAARQSSNFNVQFTPASSGSATGVLSLVSSVQTSAVSVVLSGTGVQPQISTNASSVSFGSLNVGSSNSKTVILTNSGTGTLTISQISVSGSGVSASGVATPLNLTQGQSTALSIAFNPTASATIGGKVSIVSNAPNSPLVITVSGTGVQPQLSANPASYNFGSVNAGSIGVQVVTLSNTGTSSLTVSQASVSGSGYTVTGLSFPLTLAAGQSANLSVQFAPQAAGSFPGSVTFTSNSANPATTIALSGSGLAPVVHSIVLSWDANNSNTIGYNVYSSTVSGGPYTKLTATPVATTSYTIAGVQAGQTYYYVVTSISSNNMESAFSSQVSVLVP